MGIAVLSLASVTSLVLAPLHAIVGFFAPWQSAGGALAPKTVDSPANDGGARVAMPFDGAPPAGSSSAHSRLRVLRVLEATARPDMAGRMVISGRMSDVCAELERMSQRAGAACAAQERHRHC